MKSVASLIVLFTVVLFSCTDRDDNLEGVQIRVQNATGITFSEVVIDSLIYADVQADETTFYEKYDGLELPQSIQIKGDSVEMTVAIDTVFQIDSTQLNLFTFRVKGFSEGIDTEVQVLKD